MQTTLTSKGRVTIPRNLRQLFGLRQGMAVRFTVEGDHIALRPVSVATQTSGSGFGMIQSHRVGAPADLDVASQLPDTGRADGAAPRLLSAVQSGGHVR